eukprot:TRINITY_DN6419_c0_g1_i1.p1 TRINITY_DN6419_c0_g1~~TRINITY_DN6419_c0_g1_i1.p1  ORF type:complete len:475 (+),score=29.48 TRINITY_DN6419_c0_g1_i1:52-1425(+)
MGEVCTRALRFALILICYFSCDSASRIRSVVSHTAMDPHPDSIHCTDAEWVAFLRHFGLPNHGDDKIDQYANTSFSNTHGEPCDERNVVWFWTAEGGEAFDLDRAVCFRLLQWAFRACSVHVFRVHEVEEARAVLHRFPDDSMMHMSLGGHGSPYSCRISEEDCLTFTAESQAFFSAVHAKMHRHGSIVLDSCQNAAECTGANFAKFASISVGKGVRVLAATETVYFTEVHRFEPFYTEFDGDLPVVNTVGGRCPSWAASRVVDKDGVCSCRNAEFCVAHRRLDMRSILGLEITLTTTCTVREDDCTVYTSKHSDEWQSVRNAGDRVTGMGLPYTDSNWTMRVIAPVGSMLDSCLDCVENHVVCHSSKYSRDAITSLPHSDPDGKLRKVDIKQIAKALRRNGTITINRKRVALSSLTCYQVVDCPINSRFDSNVSFLPVCTEEWSAVQCSCVDKMLQ